MDSTPRLKQLLSLLEKSPKDSFITFAIAKEYEYLNELDEALKFYEQLRLQDPSYVGTYYHLGKLFETLGKPEAALGIYNEGVEICKQAKDWHALSELNNAKTNLELGV